MSGTIIGISGGDLSSTVSLNEYAIKCTGKEHPLVLFLPTASYDAVGYIEKIREYYTGLNCSFSTLCLFSHKYTETETESLFAEADLIYVGGGDTEEMLKIWHPYGIDLKIQKAYADGKVLTGISAGMLIWFQYGFSDSDYFKNPENWDYKFIEGMNRFPYAVCPHYNEEGRSCFDERLRELKIDGIALENETAIIIENSHMYIKKSRADAKAWLLKNMDGIYQKQELTENTFF